MAGGVLAAHCLWLRAVSAVDIECRWGRKHEANTMVASLQGIIRHMCRLISTGGIMWKMNVRCDCYRAVATYQPMLFIEEPGLHGYSRYLRILKMRELMSSLGHKAGQLEVHNVRASVSINGNITAILQGLAASDP